MISWPDQVIGFFLVVTDKKSGAKYNGNGIVQVSYVFLIDPFNKNVEKYYKKHANANKEKHVIYFITFLMVLL